MADVVAWHGRDFAEHVKLRDDAAKNGYRFLTLSIYGPVSDPVYAAVMIKRPAIVAQRDWPALTAAEFQEKFDEQAELGFGPAIVSATGSAGDPRFAVVFQPQDPIPLTRHGLTSGATTDETTIQGMNAKARIAGLVLRSVGTYGDANDPRFIAVWTPNETKVTWNADGVVETSAEYQARFDAQTSGWARPVLASRNQHGKYLSLFADDEIGRWEARHEMTPAQYQDAWDDLVPQGFFPNWVEAGGNSASDARFSAIFVKKEERTPPQWKATGPVEHEGIDEVMRGIMQDSPVRHAQLAIVRDTQLVYARGYTFAPPSWPAVQPTSFFRIASVSKTVAALAIYQLIESGKLSLDTKVQSILGWKTPTGDAPADGRFGDITIGHLLEHTSGLPRDAHSDDIAIRDAHSGSHLPVTAAMADAYVASRTLAWDPGTDQEYCNCGYYVLGRVLAKKLGKATPVEALQDSLFDPLGITRIRRGRSLVTAQADDEARYRTKVDGKDADARLDIPVAASVMSDARPLVPVGYGNESYEHHEGSGGLSAGATDLARLAAILISTGDHPALKRSTIETMMDNAIACQAAFSERAGHGFDRAATRSGGRYYGQKGGSLSTSGNVFQLDGEWGVIVNWGGKPLSPKAAGWYPNFPAVMDLAESATWSVDLFPQFGMQAL
ncbi:MAG: serine hydrolase [Actinomycetota bacterium]|nr:serine hydrolase [Actinomycetota bacterium]